MVDIIDTLGELVNELKQTYQIDHYFFNKTYKILFVISDSLLADLIGVPIGGSSRYVLFHNAPIRLTVLSTKDYKTEHRPVLMYHEIAHYLYKHIKIGQYDTSPKINIREEIIADLFSAKKTSKEQVKLYLFYLMRRLQQYGRLNKNKKEMFERRLSYLNE